MSDELEAVEDDETLAPGEAAGDVRYDATISGYCRRRRGRLRETQRHVNLLVTSVARDHGSAAVELQDERLASVVREAGAAIRAYRGHRRTPQDARAAFTHLAAVAVLWAEALDTPPELKGPRLGRPSLRKVGVSPPPPGERHVTFVVPPGLLPPAEAAPEPAPAPEKQEKRAPVRRSRPLRVVPVAEGQISLLEEAA